MIGNDVYISIFIVLSHTYHLLTFAEMYIRISSVVL